MANDYDAMTPTEQYIYELECENRRLNEYIDNLHLEDIDLDGNEIQDEELPWD